MDRVKNKVAIVTGGASGLGKSSAILLAREGDKKFRIVTDIENNPNCILWSRQYLSTPYRSEKPDGWLSKHC